MKTLITVFSLRIQIFFFLRKKLIILKQKPNAHTHTRKIKQRFCHLV